MILYVCVIAVFFFAVVSYGSEWDNANAECDKICIAAGHPAGEKIIGTKHQVCECWTEKTSSPVRFLWKRDNSK
jgi:hypothetical protein